MSELHWKYLIFTQHSTVVQYARNDTGIAKLPSLRVIPDKFSKISRVAIANFQVIAEDKIE